MKKYIFYTVIALLAGTVSCADTLSGAIDRTISQAETAAKDKLGSLATDAQDRALGKLIDAQINTPFQLKFDQTALISSEALRIKFNSIVEDSRCASDVQCIQAGRFTANFSLTKNGTSLGTYNLTLGPGTTTSATQQADIYTITLNSVSPATYTSTSRPANTSYSVNLTVSR
jgi:hypothetical protein